MILDTNGLSAFFDGIESVVSLIAEADAIHLPVIVIGEYRYGLRSSRLRKQRESELIEFAECCTVLPILEPTTLAYAGVKHGLKRAGTPIPENDIWIAALSVEHGLPLLTADRHFDAVPQVKRITWD